VVSRNGAVIAFTAGDVADSGFLRATTTADPTRPLFGPSGMHDSATVAASPDGARLLVSFDSRLVLREAATGTVLAEVDPALLGAGQHAYHPEWSPDGGQIAVTLSANPVKDWSVTSGSIAVIPYQGGRFGPARVVAPQDQSDFNFYPTWSPDGRWIAFASAPLGTVSYDQAQARLRLVASTGGTVYELARATYQPGHTSTWPKFAPHMQANGNVMFVTFNSRIDYGFFLKDNATGGAPQLWLAALDLRKLPADPSSAPVWLPFQEVTQHNHLGFWSTQVGCRTETDGTSNGCGEGEACRDGRCEIVVP
jgi:Tol biopolymer transport system component